ncbi:uncharacterized protein TNCT_583941 [Trichonephila clavata]|uniref:Uncharacterized protein n=1 Tax=Trichonephila clavata TaxID=2740835 RepID=A0A8X6LK08_TRICU|nr:uncharacterized protein TNCT_583941 [Trichonephila clavata]
MICTVWTRDSSLLAYSNLSSRRLSAPPAPLSVQPIPAEEKAGGSDREPPRRQTMTTASWELAPSSNSLTLKQTSDKKKKKPEDKKYPSAS